MNKITNAELAIVKTNVAQCVNMLAPRILERLHEGFSIKACGSLYAKDAKDITAIVNDVREEFPRARIILNSDNSLIRLMVDETALTVGGGTEYIKEYVYLWDNTNNQPIEFEPRRVVSAEEIAEAKVRLEKLEAERKEIDREINNLKSILE